MRKYKEDKVRGEVRALFGRDVRLWRFGYLYAMEIDTGLEGYESF